MSDKSYTLTEAAERIGFREDTLTALLPDLGIDLAVRSPQTLTQAEYDKLFELTQRVKALHAEGVE